MKKAIVIFLVSLLLAALAVGLLALRLHLVENGSVVLRDGKLVAVPDVGYRFDGWSNGKREEALPLLENLLAKPIFVEDRLRLPSIRIETERGKEITSKETYLTCTVSISAEGDLSFDGVTARIKGRGNSTLGLDKKPYKIKFDEKISLLGEDKAKEWTLIANHMDYSLMRNYLAYKVGEALGLPYTTSANFVDVYVNGEYMGVYLVCEQVEVGKNRVDIEDSLTVDETGYLLELDARAPQEGVEGINYFYSKAGGVPYAIKSPDTEDEAFTADRVSFIKNYVDAAYDALLGTDYAEVCRYLDVDTFVNGYILDELMKTTDIGFSSFYLYRDAGGKLSRGPIWDYDLAAGNSVAAGAVSPSGIYAGTANPWYARLLTFPEFRSAVGTRLAETRGTVTETVAGAFDMADSYYDCLVRNFKKWDILGQYTMEYASREVCEIETLDGQLAYLKGWLLESLSYLEGVYVK